MILFENCVTNAHYFRIDVPECAGGGASAAHLRRCVCPRRCRGLTEDVTARAVWAVRVWVSASAIVRDWASVRVWVMVTWGSVGHGDVGECGSEAVRVWVSAEGESRGESEARWKRAIFSNPTHAERQRRVRGGMADVHAYALRRCATTGVGRWSAGRTRFQLTPDSVRGERMRRYAPQGGAAVDVGQECVSGGASAAQCVDACAPDAVGG